MNSEAQGTRQASHAGGRESAALLFQGITPGRAIPGFPMQQVAMEEPAQNKPNHQREEYQQRARHRGFPEQKTHLDDGDILSDKYHRQA
jgi:hypothetical protein